MLPTIPLFVPREETGVWLQEEPEIVGHLRKGYEEAIKSIEGLEDLFMTRAMENGHICNPEFRTDPRYFLAFEKTAANLVVISVLYVFPAHRGNGFGKSLVNLMKQQAAARDEAYLQVAVEKSQASTLGSYYEKMGFVTTGVAVRDALGAEYVDYFWARHPIAMEYIPGMGTKLGKKG